MKVFLTGVTGFLGSHVAEALLGAGHHVTALARSPSSIDPDLRPWLDPDEARSARDGRSQVEPAVSSIPGTPRAAPREDPEGRSRGVVDVSADAPEGRAGVAPTSAPGGAPDVGIVPVRGRLRLVRGSLADEGALSESLRGADAVVHVAGLIQARSEAEFMAVNQGGTAAVVRAVRARGGGLGRFVLVSSQAAGGPSADGRPVTGSDPPRPVSAYGRSKLAGEAEARALAPEVPVTILRPPVIFGPRDRMLRGFFRAVSKGVMVVWRDGSHRFSVSYAPDVARASLLALEVDHPSGSILYPCDERDFDWRGLIAALASILGRRVRVLPLPGAVFAAAAGASTGLSFLTGGPPALSFDKIAELREPYWLCSGEDARRLLGWRPSVPITRALADTHAWYRSRGLL